MFSVDPCALQYQPKASMKEVVQSFIELNELCITVPPQPTTAVPQYSAVPRCVPSPRGPLVRSCRHARLPPTAPRLVGQCTDAFAKERRRCYVEQVLLGFGIAPPAEC